MEEEDKNNKKPPKPDSEINATFCNTINEKKKIKK